MPVIPEDERDDFVPDSYSTNVLAALLYWHILKKGFQVGSVLAVPLSALRVYRRGFDFSSLLKVAGMTASAATAATGALGAARFTQLDRDGFADRAYRLHYNAGQNRVDALGAGGAGVGVAATALALSSQKLPYRPVYFAGGAAYGVAAGVLLHVLTSRKAETEA